MAATRAIAACDRAKLATVVDESLLGDRTVFVSAGRRGLEIELLPEALVSLPGATVAHIARRD